MEGKTMFIWHLERMEQRAQHMKKFYVDINFISEGEERKLFHPWQRKIAHFGEWETRRKFFFFISAYHSSSSSFIVTFPLRRNNISIGLFTHDKREKYERMTMEREKPRFCCRKQNIEFSRRNGRSLRIMINDKWLKYDRGNYFYYTLFDKQCHILPAPGISLETNLNFPLTRLLSIPAILETGERVLRRFLNRKWYFILYTHLASHIILLAMSTHRDVSERE